MVSTQTRSNKRPASQDKRQAGKKVVLTNSNGRPVAKGKEKEKEKAPRRSRPVTAPVIDDEDEEDDEENENDFEDDQDIESGDMNTTEPAPKDPNASRESHKVQKELHAQRRAAKPHSALLIDAKRLWAQARRTDITTTERRKHVGALMNIVRGHVKDLVLKHDASRIIQTLVKRGTAKEREEIAGELKGQYKALAQSRYSKFLVAKLIRLCPTYRSSILTEFAGSVPRLLLHREAAGILADAFELHANAAERGILLRDFYGPEARLASFTPGSKEDTEQARKGLAGLLEGADPERRKRILGAVKSHLTSIFNNPDKGAVTHAIVHRVLWEYLAVINDEPNESEQGNLRREIFDNCQDVLAEMVHTKDGSRAVREFIAHGSAKDRKHVIKALKPHIERMCTSDEAQLVLFSALDIIDDTKLTGKSLVADVVSYAPSLVTSSQGRRALLYPLVGRTRRHLTPAQIVTLSETDTIRATTSKKDDTVRADEIRKACSEGMLEWIVKDGVSVARDTGGSLVVTDCLLYADGDKTSAIEALLKDAATPYPSDDPEHPHPLDLPHTSRMYKTLLQGGHYSQTSRAVDVSPHFSASAFADAFVRIVGKDVILASATGPGAFVVAALCERLVEGDSNLETRNTVKAWFDGGERVKLEEWTGRGKAVLVEAVSKL